MKIKSQFIYYLQKVFEVIHCLFVDEFITVVSEDEYFKLMQRQFVVKFLLTFMSTVGLFMIATELLLCEPPFSFSVTCSTPIFLIKLPSSCQSILGESLTHHEALPSSSSIIPY